jgi:hypothetical protein
LLRSLAAEISREVVDLPLAETIVTEGRKFQ